MQPNEEVLFLVALKEHFPMAGKADGDTLWEQLKDFSLDHCKQAMSELMRASKSGRPEIDRLITITKRIDAQARGEVTSVTERTTQYLQSQRKWRIEHDLATEGERRFIESLSAVECVELEDSTSEYLRRKYGELGRRVAAKGVGHRLFRITMCEIHRARLEVASCG